jgi:hypothetical protein
MLKSKLVNLYIYPEHYNENYNFYNYHKFKQTKNINILYKSPSIFLNGLYFELPYAQIVRIEKPLNSTNFNITIQINPTYFATPSVTVKAIQQCFEKIDSFNQAFFVKHGAKLEIRPRRTLKSASELQQQDSEGKDKAITPRFAMPTYRNPITRKFTYEPFFTVDQISGVLIMQLEIKHIYMQRIFQALLEGDTIKTANKTRDPEHVLDTEKSQFMVGKSAPHCTGLEKISKEMLAFIEQEFFDFKRSALDMNTQDSLLVPIRFWIKSNMFVTEAGRLLMKWKICDFSV